MRTVLCLSLFGALSVYAQGTGAIKLKVKPGDAAVILNGKYLGPAANFGSGRTYSGLPAGEHELKLVDPRYEDAVVKVKVEAGKTVKVQQELKKLTPAQPPFGVLRVKHADRFAGVFLNGRYYGWVDEVDNFAQGIKLKGGEYELKVVPTAGGAEFSQKVKIEENKTTLIEAK
ncbi:MAG: PEGA domain-containing protein [Bryobacteraceae bacterium]|nr:PEGA domain-containing protein [Bryobacteraceae bacterium]